MLSQNIEEQVFNVDNTDVSLPLFFDVPVTGGPIITTRIINVL